LLNKAQPTRALIDTGGDYHLGALNFRSDQSSSFSSNILSFFLIVLPSLQLYQYLDHLAKHQPPCTLSNLLRQEKPENSVPHTLYSKGKKEFALTEQATAPAILRPQFIKFSRKAASWWSRVSGGIEPVYITLVVLEAPANPSTIRVARGRISAKLALTILPSLNRIPYLASETRSMSLSAFTAASSLFN
jgi:hypothetical protein